MLARAPDDDMRAAPGRGPRGLGWLLPLAMLVAGCGNEAPETPVRTSVPTP